MTLQSTLDSREKHPTSPIHEQTTKLLKPLPPYLNGSQLYSPMQKPIQQIHSFTCITTLCCSLNLNRKERDSILRPPQTSGCSLVWQASWLLAYDFWKGWTLPLGPLSILVQGAEQQHLLSVKTLKPKTKPHIRTSWNWNKGQHPGESWIPDFLLRRQALCRCAVLSWPISGFSGTEQGRVMLWSPTGSLVTSWQPSDGIRFDSY